jgi:hypothetical protein
VRQDRSLDVDDAHVELGHQDQHPSTDVCAPDSDVAQSRAIAERDRPGLVDDVVADLGSGEDRLTVDFGRGLVEGSPGRNLCVNYLTESQ